MPAMNSSDGMFQHNAKSNRIQIRKEVAAPIPLTISA